MESTKVGIREFRQDLVEYINTGKPVTITRHGRTVGYFVPAKGPSEAQIEALRNAGAELDGALAAQGVNIDDLLQEFNALRKKARAKAAGLAR